MGPRTSGERRRAHIRFVAFASKRQNKYIFFKMANVTALLVEKSVKKKQGRLSGRPCHAVIERATRHSTVTTAPAEWAVISG